MNQYYAFEINMRERIIIMRLEVKELNQEQANRMENMISTLITSLGSFRSEMKSEISDMKSEITDLKSEISDLKKAIKSNETENSTFYERRISPDASRK